MQGLSIVIPTLGRSAALRDVVESLGRQEPSATEVEVFIVLDAAASPPRWLSDRLEGALHTKVVQASSAGASAARNAGWRAASFPLILFLDDDIVASERLLAEHQSWHQRHPEPEVGVLGLVRWSPRMKVTPFMRWLESGIQFDYGAIEGDDAQWSRLYSCNVSVKREMLERVNGFDAQTFPFGYEDLDLGLRMSRHGFRLLFNRAAVGDHLKTETIDSWRLKLERIAISEHRFIERYPDQRAYFYELFRAAADAPAARGRSARLARVVRPATPWLGPLVWRSFDLVCAQELAPDFLSSWEKCEAEHAIGLHDNPARGIHA